MNKKMKRFLSIVLAMVMCLALAMPVFAAETEKNTSGKVQIDKNLTVGTKAVLPDDGLEFEFTLAENGADPEVEGWSYRSSADTISEIDVTGTNVTWTKDTGNIKLKYLQSDKTGTETNITKSFVIDFTNVKWSAPGVYRYKVTETNGTANGVKYNKDGYTYYIDVYVQNKGESDFEIANIVVTRHGNVTTKKPSNDNDEYENKVNATVGSSDADFNNELASYKLTITKKVDGNQGNKTKNFTFTVKVEGLPNGTYHYNAGGDKTQTVSNSTSDNGWFEITGLTLKDLESMEFYDLPKGAKWTVTETTGAEDYTTSWSYTETDTTDSSTSSTPDEDSKTAKDTTTGMEGNTDLTITNTKEGIVPTGVLMTVAPFAALMIIGFVGAAVILTKKRRSY